MGKEIRYTRDELVKKTGEIIDDSQVGLKRAQTHKSRNNLNNVLAFWEAVHCHLQTKDFDSVINDHLEFTSKTFPKGTARGALLHMKREIDEVIADMDNGASMENKATEFADIFGCLIDSANREGVSPNALLKAFAAKLEINKDRQWKDNGDGSYSHIK
jgi:Protein of unknown function (DUF550)